MKTIENKVENTYYSYEAIDGQRFNSKEECEKYELGAMCAIRTRIKDMAIRSGKAYEFFIDGCGDNRVDVCIPKNDRDIDAIRQYCCFISGSKTATSIGSDDIGKVLIIMTGYDDDWVTVQRLDDLLDALTGGTYEAIPRAQ